MKKDANKTFVILNRDLKRILDLSKKWKITFQPTKTKDIVFSQKPINNIPPLKFDHKDIKRVNCHKHLGVYLTSNLD